MLGMIAAATLPLVSIGSSDEIASASKSFVSENAEVAMGEGGEALCLVQQERDGTSYICLTRDEWQAAIKQAASIKARDRAISHGLNSLRPSTRAHGYTSTRGMTR